MSILTSAAASKTLRLGLAVGLAGAAFVGAVATSQSAQAATTTAKGTLAPATGPGAGTAAATTTQVVTLTGTGFTDAVGASVIGTLGTAYNSTVGGVQFNSASACPAAAATADGSAIYNILTANLAIVSSTKLVINVPTMLLSGTTPNFTSKAYRLCVYDNTGTAGAAGALISDAAYTVYPAPQVTKVSPNAGAITGGTTITVMANNLTAKATATINGQALTGIKVAKDLKSFTGVVPQAAAIPGVSTHVPTGSTYNVVVTTEGGPSANNAALDDFTYNNEVTVSPKVVVPGVNSVITVTGKGFNTVLNPTNGAPAANAQVVIAKNQFDDTTAGNVTATTAVLCSAVKVISDTQLVCTVPSAFTTVGAYIVTITDDNTAAAGQKYQSVVSSSATLTVAAD